MPQVRRKRIIRGDCKATLVKRFDNNTFTAVVTDPPYGLKFMGKDWDHGVPGVPYWESIYRVCKPGAFLLAFGGTRTYHRLVCAIEDAGWEIRDQLAWVYGSGFPKSHDISKAIDSKSGKKRKRGPMKRGGQRLMSQAPDGIRDGQGRWGNEVGRDPYTSLPATEAAQLWNGWGTALKPAHEPIVLAMKPLDGTFAANALKHGVAGLAIDRCRIETDGDRPLRQHTHRSGNIYGSGLEGSKAVGTTTEGRWPANLIHDGSEEVLGVFAQQSKAMGMHSAGKSRKGSKKKRKTTNKGRTSYDTSTFSSLETMHRFGDDGSASRFFYCAKASKKERTVKGDVECNHPTVKPLSLMRYLLQLVTMPKINYILDPFCGSGSTLIACQQLGLTYVGIDNDPESTKTAVARLKAFRKLPNGGIDL